MASLACLWMARAFCLSFLQEKGGFSFCLSGQQGSELPCGTPRQESPGIVSVQQRNVGSSGVGVVPPPQVIRLAQSRVPSLGLVSPFPY